ncbi:hypothetical protein AAG594_05815 [Citromicrobium bathyomarinum]
MIELAKNIGLIILGLALAALALSVLIALVQILISDRRKVGSLADRAGNLNDLWRGTMPVKSHGDRRFECTAGLTVDLRTGSILESARVSDEMIEEAFSR